jgi:hypothetical protein
MKTQLTFGAALRALKSGQAVARDGWNGKGLQIYLVPANAYPAQTPIAKAIYGETLVPYKAYLALRDAAGEVSPWAPSCNDALAEDWYILP